MGTGYGGIDTGYAASKGVTVTNIADYATEAVAEFAMAVLLEHLRDITRARTQVLARDYSGDFRASEIKGKRFGVVGLGNIGLRTAQLAQAFGAEVSYWSRHRKPDAEQVGITYQELDQLLAQADIVSLHLALNDATRGIISADLIRSLKPGCVLINLSPMELLDFAALLSRLRAKELVCILDHSDELPTEQLHNLQALDNCRMYPPIAYLTHEASGFKQRLYIDNLRSYLGGNPLNKVN